jgi:hypothetical protein
MTDMKIKGPWRQAEIDRFLLEARFPLRLACVAPDGFPRVVSVWYLYEGGKLLCASHASSQLVALLEKSPRVGFEVAPNEPPYHGVRGQGVATLTPREGGPVLEALIARYLGGSESPLASWLLSRADEEALISIEPRRWFSWDYRERMG